jgi:hypothetical protein
MGKYVRAASIPIKHACPHPRHGIGPFAVPIVHDGYVSQLRMGVEFATSPATSSWFKAGITRIEVLVLTLPQFLHGEYPARA